MQFVALDQVILWASTGKASGTHFSNPFVNATPSAEFVDELSVCRISFAPIPRYDDGRCWRAVAIFFFSGAGAMSMFEISVKRGKTSGTLSYSGTFELETKCWWDLARRIPAAEYTGCSATTMATKKNSQGQPREAIFFPNVPGFTGIFVHMGNSAAWSDGCIVIEETLIKQIYNDIVPKNGRNVTITVEDVSS